MSIISSSYPIIRKILFSIDAETAHNLTLFMLNKTYKYNFLRKKLHSSINLPSKIMGLNVKNPIGLAAGLDKNGECIDALGNLGFGFMEIGTVTPYAQNGNQKPRIFRLPKANAIINRLGFNNHGIEKILDNIKNNEWQKNDNLLGINIGKNFNTELKNAADDYTFCLKKAYPYADYITINISSPNTKNLRDLQNTYYLENLLTQIKETHKELVDNYNKYVPIALKISPDLINEEIEDISTLLLKYKIDGVIATNTTISRKKIETLKNHDQLGGLSGEPLHELSLNVIRRLKSLLGQEITIIGTGGIISGQQAKEKIEAGANAIQIYTGLIYKGPSIIEECFNLIKENININ
ncbi:quinone-dependent dihydroorotate dehydrogenase [Candidatus Kinetoplastidibacterium crithidiae]|uniref:Dihydroorotate dehydrogenase (quinone) n=1 Tax=Candidatus Kinetoplastidibacterium crithidiae TCC036E TaxID=1208918 RepID=M1LX85_9PROT|nr:quinone-dependent dihydroorotate dehydrogenase [Candidatus Kinetoplastibacterium crithidii]AFZ82524.1 dihydroorotate dehydrogenase [Candidatus Kinetoplastibacterium crithidii (ex Angomonas deanei ATCC 30255)]AGF47814.1 dihydroorotate oxidase [Candidatus Kinetoplastibacterium crithidii TCC036E]